MSAKTPLSAGLPVFGLVDCNHFYAAVERVFRPDLAHTPIVVLSNNDGCVIARSYDAKPYVKMGVFSVDFLFHINGQVSERVMTVIESMVSESETYSIDEKFLTLTGMPGNLTGFGREIRAKVLKHTGIPVGVGIAHTKTLAKLANHTAKRFQGSIEKTDKIVRQAFDLSG